jgi:hypothetical protein
MPLGGIAACSKEFSTQEFGSPLSNCDWTIISRDRYVAKADLYSINAVPTNSQPKSTICPSGWSLHTDCYRQVMLARLSTVEESKPSARVIRVNSLSEQLHSSEKVLSVR